MLQEWQRWEPFESEYFLIYGDFSGILWLWAALVQCSCGCVYIKRGWFPLFHKRQLSKHPTNQIWRGSRPLLVIRQASLARAFGTGLMFCLVSVSPIYMYHSVLVSICRLFCFASHSCPVFNNILCLNIDGLQMLRFTPHSHPMFLFKYWWTPNAPLRSAFPSHVLV